MGNVCVWRRKKRGFLGRLFDRIFHRPVQMEGIVLNLPDSFMFQGKRPSRPTRTIYRSYRRVEGND